MTTPEGRRHPFYFQIDLLHWLSIYVILGLAGWARFFSLPSLPFSDPDTWGYLHPGLSGITVGIFTHTYGRSFPYPFFVYLLLSTTHTFVSIAVAQHLLGLATGVLMIRTWHRATAFINLDRWAFIVHRVLGFVVLAVFLFSKSTLLMEHSIRPEAVFPFFTMLALYLAVEFGIARFTSNSQDTSADNVLPLHSRKIFVLGTLLIFDSVFVYFLKPAWGFGAGFAVLPVIVSLFVFRDRLAYKLSLLALPLLLALVTLWYPEKRLVDLYDPGSERFLGSLLLCFHANFIREEMIADLRSSAPLRCDRKTLETVEKLIDEELKDDHKSEHVYKSLGFDPDNLLYHQRCIVTVLESYFGTDIAAYKAFCFSYYEKAWLHQPLAMSRKVIRQLWGFYNFKNPAFDTRRGSASFIETAYTAQRSVGSVPHSFSTTLLAGNPLPPCPIFSGYLEQEEALMNSPGVWKQPSWTIRCARVLAALYTPVLLLSLLAAIFVLRRHALIAPGNIAFAALFALYFFGYNFGNCLTIAVTHTMEVSRYTKNQLVFTAFSEAFGILLLLSAASAFLRSRGQLTKEE